MENKYKKLGKNTFLVFIGQAGSSLISLLMLPLYTNWLTTDEYGTVDLMSTYATILLSIITCCIADAIFIFPKGASNEDKTKYFSSGFAFVIFTTVCAYTLNALLYSVYKEGSFWKTYSWLTLLLMFSMFIQRYFQQFTRSLEKMKVFALTGIIYTISVAVFAILLIPLLNLKGYVYSLIVANIISASSSFILSKSYKYISININSYYLKTLLYYSIPLIPNSIMWWLVNGLNRPLMDTYLGMSAIGLFAIANKFPGIVSMAANIFSNAWGISLLDEFNKPGFSEFFNKVFKLITFISVIASFIIIIFSKEIITLFASDSFQAAWHLLPLLVIGAVLNSSAGLIGGIFMAIKKSKYFFYSSAVGAITSIVLTLILIKTMGLIGCALAIFASFLFMLLMRIKFAWKYICGFKIKHYGIMLIMLLLTYVVLELKISFLYKSIIYSLIFIILILTNQDILGLIINKIRRYSIK